MSKEIQILQSIQADIVQPERKKKKTYIDELKQQLKFAIDEMRRWRIAVSRAVTQAQLQNIVDIVHHIQDPNDPGDYGTPRTDDYYIHPKVGMRKCLCGVEGCNKFWLTGIGTFANGVGFTEDEARDIVEVLKTLPKYQLKLENRNEIKRKTVYKD